MGDARFGRAWTPRGARPESRHRDLWYKARGLRCGARSAAPLIRSERCLPRSPTMNHAGKDVRHRKVGHPRSRKEKEIRMKKREHERKTMQEQRQMQRPCTLMKNKKKKTCEKGGIVHRSVLWHKQTKIFAGFRLRFSVIFCSVANMDKTGWICHRVRVSLSTSVFPYVLAVTSGVIPAYGPLKHDGPNVAASPCLDIKPALAVAKALREQCGRVIRLP
ncbi:hypothetical protein MRX96_026267 [Rhipicephalus microplus]